MWLCLAAGKEKGHDNTNEKDAALLESNLFFCCLHYVNSGYLLLNLLLSKEARDEVVQQEVVATEDCMTPYTYIEENADGAFDLFIYSSAVQSLEKNEYQKIENALLRSDQKGFSYENTENGVKKYFGAQEEQVLLEYDNQSVPISFCKTAPQPTKMQFSNMYGDSKEAVCYEMASDYLLYTYPINKGVQF